MHPTWLSPRKTDREELFTVGDGKLVFITGDDFKTYNKKVKVRILDTLTVEFASHIIRRLSTLTYLVKSISKCNCSIAHLTENEVKS